jgi:hypothetical protein
MLPSRHAFWSFSNWNIIMNQMTYNTIHVSFKHENSLHNTIQYNTIQYNTIQHNTTQYNTIQHNTIQYTAIHYNTIQYNTTQYNTIQYNTIGKLTHKYSTTLEGKLREVEGEERPPLVLVVPNPRCHLAKTGRIGVLQVIHSACARAVVTHGSRLEDSFCVDVVEGHYNE